MIGRREEGAMEREKRKEEESLREVRREKKETEVNENEREGEEGRPEILWIIVPYRDREKQLKEWLPRVCEYLQALTSSSSPGVHTPQQGVSSPGVYTPQQHVKTEVFIAIAEQDDRFLFNKGALMNAAVAWILRHLLQNNEEQKVDQEEEENTSPPHSSCSSSPPPSSSSPSSSSSSYDHASRLSSPLRSLSSSFFFTPPEKILSSSETSGEMRSLKEHGDDPKTKRKGEVATSQGTTGEKKERRKEDPRPFYTCIGELIDSLPLLSRVSLCFHDVDILPRRRQLDSVTSLPTHRLCLYVPLPVEGCVHHLYGHRWSLGGVLILRSLDFLLKAKGWSVRYPGWGYEDDDMLARCLHADLWIDQSSSIMTKLTRKEERERKLLPPDSSSSSSLSSLPLRQGGVVRVKQREEEDKRDNMTRQHDESKKRSFDDPLKEERKSETREKRRKSLEKAWCACGCFSERFSPLSPFEEFDVHRFLSHQDRLRHMHKQLQTAQAKRNRRLFMRTWRLEEEEKEQEEEEADEDNNDEKEDVVVDEAQDTHEKDKEDEGRGDEDNEDIHEEEEREGLLIRSERGCGDSGTRHEKEEDRKKKKRKRRNGEEGKGEERGRPPPIEVEDGVDVVFKAWLETHPHAEENRQKPPKISIDVSQNSLKNLFPFMTLATQEKDYDDEERQKRNETRSTRREGERRLDRRIDSCGKEENRRDEDWNTDQTRHAEKEKEEAEKDEQHHSKSDTSKSFMVDEETDTTERSRKKKRTNSSSLSEEIMKNTKSVTHKSSLSSSSFSSSPLFHYYVFPSSPNARCVWLKIHFNQIEKIFYKEEEDS